jgi:hypothetical protein
MGCSPSPRKKTGSWFRQTLISARCSPCQADRNTTGAILASFEHEVLRPRDVQASEDVKESSSPEGIDLIKQDGTWYIESSPFL